MSTTEMGEAAGAAERGGPQYKAFLRIRRFDTREIVESIGLTVLSEHHTERVMRGLLHNMNTDEYFVDDSEVYEARAEESK